jgi:hypothetical protein
MPDKEVVAEMSAIYIALAGIMPLIAYFGAGSVLVLGLLAAAWFSPVFKKEFLWSAMVVGAFMAAFTWEFTTVNNVSAPNGKPQTRSGSKRPRSHIRMLFALCAVSALAGCQHTEQLIAATARQAKCDWTRNITYSKKDTAPTVEQIQIHNQSGRNQKCWK